MRAYLAGILTVLVAGATIALIVVWFGLFPAGADVKPPAIEKWSANHAIDATIAREEPQPPYPFGPPTDATILAGAKLYMTSCAVCHGSGGSDESIIAKGMYIKPPQFPKHGVDDDPEGETYWKIEHGYRFTGMPSFKGNLTEEQIWQIAYFLKRPSDQLPPDAKKIWNQPHGD